MKKLSISIVILLSYFGVIHTTSAQSIDELLEIQSGIEAFDIETISIDKHSFKSVAIQEVYENFVAVNRILKDELIRKYQAGEFEYYQMQGIIQNHKSFVFHTNKLFTYLAIKDSGIRTKEINTAIIRSYQNVRISYTRMKNLINQSY